MNLQTRNKTNSERDNSKKLTLQPAQQIEMRLDDFDFDRNNAQLNETLREKHVYPDKFSQEPDAEERHHVKPFHALSQSDESVTPVKEEIVSKISTQKKQLADLSELDNIKLVYQSHQTTDGEPEVQELSVSQIFDHTSKKLHK